ncbi:MAG: TAXI family TRAP transporter solute-binding subunit [Acetobacteraceae bacterium]|nr:TAXI family TRAP transporter solute-binding subunit [Acetobacteraceae bacterium]
MVRIDRRTLLGGALGLPAASVLAGPARAEGTQIAIATGTTGGVYYPLGGGMANLMNKAIPGMAATVEVTGGSVANLQLLGAGRVGMVLAQGDAVVDAVRGEGRFQGKPVPVRTILVMYINQMQVVTTAASGARTMPELKGKRISTGAPGSATEVFALRLIEAAGMKPDSDFRARERLSPAESGNAIKDGKLDAYFFVSGVPTSAITDLGATPGVELVLIDHAQYGPAMSAKYGPVYFAAEIPAGTYPGQKTVNHGLAVSNIVGMRADAPDALVKSILAALWDQREDLYRVHSAAKDITLAGQKTVRAVAPWHPAAEAFWKAHGANLG